jgi:hypothetical protein
MARDFDEFFETLTDEEQERVKRNLLGEREEEKPTPMERLRRGFAAQPDPAEIREARKAYRDEANR